MSGLHRCKQIVFKIYKYRRTNDHWTKVAANTEIYIFYCLWQIPPLVTCTNAAVNTAAGSK